MQTFLVVLLFCVLLCNIAKGAESRWSILRQSDYDIKIEMAKAESVNSSYVKYMKVEAVPYNRTIRVLNASLEFFVDLDKKVMILLKSYKFVSNEYRYFPMTFEFNFCDEYSRDSFGMKQMFDGSSNIRPCPMKKDIPYRMINGLPDYSKFPPYIPFGRYQIRLDLLDRNNTMYTLVSHIEVKEKHKNWIP